MLDETIWYKQAAAVACGQDMDVPEIILYGTTLVSPSIPVTVEASDHAAIISAPGAVKSGCTKFYEVKIKK